MQLDTKCLIKCLFNWDLTRANKYSIITHDQTDSPRSDSELRRYSSSFSGFFSVNPSLKQMSQLQIAFSLHPWSHASNRNIWLSEANMNRVALCMWERRCFTQVFMLWRMTINRPIKIDSVVPQHVSTNRYQAGAGSNEQHAFRARQRLFVTEGLGKKTSEMLI